MTCVKVITIYTILLLCAQRLWKIDMTDRTHPYGLDMVLNRKRAGKIQGEGYGVSVFWGKPKGVDTAKNRLDKIEWLAGSYQREVKWRRALFFGVIATFILSIIRNEFNSVQLREFLVSTLVIAGFVYFSHTYYDHHLNHFRNKYIRNHVKAIKKEYNLDLYNPIYEYI